MNEALLRVEGLARHFRLRGGIPGRRPVLRAVDGVSFTLDHGRTFGLVGESGCGKTTLARAVLRLHEPTAGTVRLDGVDITGLARGALRRARRDMQMIFQDPFASLSPRRTVAQIVREPMDVHRVGEASSRRQRVAELLQRVGLDRRAMDRFPHEFSGGQRQRIAIARALAPGPKLIVADEAVSALDMSVQSQVLNLLAELQAEFGTGYLFISHDLSVVRHVSHVVGVMHLGKLVEVAPAARLFSAPAHPYTRALMDAVPEPDPSRRPARRPLRGEIPSPVDPPPGCPFHTRCPEAMPVCRTRVPRTIDVGNEGSPHRVTCHLHDRGVRS
ncbi:MAG: ABC transporter ATP-binding protein [Candidatus Wenzhouxiangella sp. M2_3B_020]